MTEQPPTENHISQSP